MKKFRQFVNQFDLFDAPYEFEIESSKRRHATLMGSVYTILSIIATLIYLSYRLSQWKNYKLSPVITRNRIIDQD